MVRKKEPPRRENRAVTIILGHHGREVDREVAVRGTDAARTAILTICRLGDRGLIAGDAVCVIDAD